ncbi:MAG: sugar transferase, partial [Sedimentisphaerales bacterium]
NGNSKSPMIKLDDHPQIILFGKILRKMCIDELPQLINVLLGEMSMVGPRPPLTYEVEEYLQWNYARFDAVPGMTGLWQVSGKNRLTFTKMMQLDIRYSRKMSLWLDIKILLKTPLAIVSQISDTLPSRKSERLIEELVETA